MFTEITESIRRSFRISGSKGLQITFTIVPNTVQKLIPCSITAHSIRPYSPFFSFDMEGQSFNLNNGKISFTSHCVPKLFNMKLEQWCSPSFFVLPGTASKTYIGSVLFRTSAYTGAKQASRVPYWFRILSRQNHLVPGHLVPFLSSG